MSRRAEQYRADTLLNGLAFIETASHLDNSARVECGLAALGVPWTASGIMGRPAAGIERRALRRVAAELEHEKLIVRVLDAGAGERLTHFRLTKAGFTRAVELAEGGAALDVIADVLDSLDWGRPLARLARKMHAKAADQTDAQTTHPPAGPPAKKPCPSQKETPDAMDPSFPNPRRGTRQKNRLRSRRAE